MGSVIFKFTDEQIKRAVQESFSYAETLRKLGASPLTQHVKTRIGKLGLSTHHWQRIRYSLTKEKLENVVPMSKSYADVACKLGLKSIGGNIISIRTAIERNHIDISHFVHQAHRKGQPSRGRVPHEEILKLRTPTERRIRSVQLRRAALDSGIEYKCSICSQLPIWQGKELCLQLDHINGLPWDNRKENLRFVCPNCHTQLDTYGSKNIEHRSIRTL